MSLHEVLLGADYARLAPALQRFHRLAGRVVLHGRVTTRAPMSPLARALGRALGTPGDAAEGPLVFELDAGPDAETWTRRFPTRTMRSCMRRAGGALEERLGPATCRFTLHATAEGGLAMTLTGLSFLGVPCPAWLRPRIVATETADGDRLYFDVSAALPLLGEVAGDRGYLEVPP